MGWELRRGKRVYIRKVRDGGRVRSIYFAAGEPSETAAREDLEKRLARRAGATQKEPSTTAEVVVLAPESVSPAHVRDVENEPVAAEKCEIVPVNESVEAIQAGAEPQPDFVQKFLEELARKGDWQARELLRSRS